MGGVQTRRAKMTRRRRGEGGEAKEEEESMPTI
jgi:hypothetical protein